MSNKYLSIGIIVFLITLPPVFCAENEILWKKTYDGGSTDMAHGVTVDSKDNVIVTGTSYDAQKRSRDYYTIKYDKSGNVIWEKRFDVGIRDVSYDVVVDSKDNVIVTGTVSGRFFTIKYDKYGKVIWTDMPGRGNDDEAYGVAVDSEDNILVTGRTKLVVYNYYTLKYDKDGNLLWRIMWTKGEDDVPYDVAVDSQDNVLVTGFTSNGAEHRGRADYTYYTFKYDKNGKKLWHGKWAISHSYAEAYGIATDSWDNVIVTGFIMENNNRDYFTLKCDPSGKILWERVYDRSFYDCAYGITTDQNDNIFVTGISYSGIDNYDICTIKYTPEGKLQWEKILDINRNDIAEDITVDSEGRVIVVGSTDSKSWDFLTIKYENK